MAIKKQYLKSKPICKVTFTVPAEEAKKVDNKLQAKVTELKKQGILVLCCVVLCCVVKCHYTCLSLKPQLDKV